jgi:predicted dehydrogenase
MVNAALIGYGWWGKNLAKAIQNKSDQLQFTMIVTKEIEDARTHITDPKIQICENLEDALNNPAIDAVVLATPHSLHAEQIIAAANSGKHVFCEKPLALTHQEASEAIAACQKNQRVLAVGQNKRFWPSMVKLREIVKSGVLGNIMHIEGHYSNEHSTKFFSDWRGSSKESPAGGLTGTGIHLVDAFTGIAGAAKEVTARVTTFREGKDPRDSTMVNIHFKNGISAYFAMIRATPIYWRVHVFGDEGSVEALWENECVLRLNGYKLERFQFDLVDSIHAELEAFAVAVTSNEATPYPISTTEMAQTIELFEAIVQSVNEHKTIQLPG